MAGLVLKLRPREELVINGVLVENGDRKAMLRIKSEDAQILRLRGALKAEEANTPAARACYIAQLAVGGLVARREAAEMLAGAVAEMGEALSADARSDIDRHMAAGDFYPVMRMLSALIGRGQDGRATADAEA